METAFSELLRRSSKTLAGKSVSTQGLIRDDDGFREGAALVVNVLAAIERWKQTVDHFATFFVAGIAALERRFT